MLFDGLTVFVQLRTMCESRDEQVDVVVLDAEFFAGKCVIYVVIHIPVIC